MNQELKANVSKLHESKKSCSSIREKEKMTTYKLVIPSPYDRNPHASKAIVDVRTFMGRSRNASVVYAIVWISGEGAGYGVGQAGGYGYHKESAAIAYALEDAGVELSYSISGAGEGAIREALVATAKALGYDDFLIVES